MSKYFSGQDGVVHTFPDDVTPEEVKAALGTPGASSSQSSGSFGGFPSGINPMNPGASLGASLKAMALEALPTLGGFVGGIGGGIAGGLPGGIAGAALGGAWGEGMRESASGQPVSVGNIAGRGAEQGAYELGGQALARGAGKLARPIMRRALGAGKSILSNFPEVAETALSNGLVVSEGGAAKASRLREESSQALYDLLNQAKASGTTFNTSDITQHARALLNTVLPSREKARLAKSIAEFASDHGTQIDPVVLKEIKQLYQTRAASVYDAAGQGIPTLAQANRALLSEKLAQGAQGQLETIPGVAGQEARTQSLIGAQRAIENTVTRAPRPIEMHKPGSWPLPFVNGPQALSRVALFLDHPGFKATLRQSPRLAAALLMHQLSQPDQTAVGQ